MKSGWFAATATIAWALAGAASAQDAAALARIEALEAQIQLMQTQLAELRAVAVAAPVPTQQAAPLAAPAPATIVSIEEGRPTIASQDGAFSAALYGVAQLDAAHYFEQFHLADRNSGTEIRRARLGVKGTLFSDFDYNLLFDFADGGLQEAWLEYAKLRPFTVRAGAFAPNVGLADAASTTGSLFPERPSVSEVTRNMVGGDRRIGVQATAERWGWLAVVAVTGSKVGEDDFTDEQFGYAARLAGTPLRGSDWLVHVGVNASVIARPANGKGPNGLKTYDVILEDWQELRVDNTKLITTNGSVTSMWARRADHVGLELAVQDRNIFLQGEYFEIDVQRLLYPNVDFRGWYVEGGWMITGQQRRYNPRTAAFDGPMVGEAFDPYAGRWGAWEMAVRYSVLDLSDRTDAPLTFDQVNGGEQTIRTLGVNWFLNQSIKVSLDYFSVYIDRPLAYPNFPGASPSYDAVNLRGEFAF